MTGRLSVTYLTILQTYGRAKSPEPDLSRDEYSTCFRKIIKLLGETRGRQLVVHPQQHAAAAVDLRVKR